MTWMNEFDIENALLAWNDSGTPNLFAAATALSRLREWTNAHSDGWPYWRRPSEVAGKLQELLEQRAAVARAAGRSGSGEFKDITTKELEDVLTPLVYFLAVEGREADKQLDGDGIDHIVAKDLWSGTRNARRSTEPIDRLTGLCAEMTQVLERPENDDVKAIVFLDAGDHGGLEMHGWEDDFDAMSSLFAHIQAVFRANGKDLEFIGVPDSPEGISS